MKLDQERLKAAIAETRAGLKATLRVDDPDDDPDFEEILGRYIALLGYSQIVAKCFDAETLAVAKKAADLIEADFETWQRAKDGKH